MRTFQRAAAVLIYPAILCMGVACERANPPTASPRAGGPRAELSAPSASATSEVTDWLARALSLGELLSDDVRMTAWTDEPEDDDHDPITVVPFEFDPGKTHLVRSRWLRGTGCPTDATALIDDPTTLAFDPTPTPFTDPACPTAHPKASPGTND